MTLLLGSAAFFLAIHLLVSGTPVRGLLVSRLGEGPYRGLFALLSLVGLVAMGFGFAQAGPSARAPLYDLGLWSLVQTTPAIFIAFQFIVLAFMFPNPTSAGGDEYLAQATTPPAPVGVQNITRHPFLWGVMLWSGSHLVAPASPRDLVLFGSLLITAFLGTFAIDAKRRQALGDKWNAYARLTSNLPFLALFQGRARLRLREISWRPLVPVLFFGGFYAAHGLLFGIALPPH